MTYVNTLETIKNINVNSEMKQQLLMAVVNDSENVNLSNRETELLTELNDHVKGNAGSPVTQSKTQRPTTLQEIAEAKRLIK
ncbi:hypothetical protein ACMGE9_02580 [Macrococcus sp. EM39E]|uniref:hypothetical protein n=1 Tax=Macrococcus animalis TaxID=3395467 RepID=UPI0039BE9264